MSEAVVLDHLPSKVSFMKTKYTGWKIGYVYAFFVHKVYLYVQHYITFLEVF